METNISSPIKKKRVRLSRALSPVQTLVRIQSILNEVYSRPYIKTIFMHSNNITAALDEADKESSFEGTPQFNRANLQMAFRRANECARIANDFLNSISLKEKSAS